jgi:hypothetical protein
MDLLNHDLNCLVDSDRGIRLRASDKLSKSLLEPSVSPIFVGTCLRPLLRAFSDTVERCRTSAIAVVSHWVAKDPAVARGSLPLLVPVLVERIGQPVVAEETEELRLALVELVLSALNVAEEEVADYKEEIVLILTRALADSFADVKKTACQAVEALVRVAPRHASTASPALIKAVVPNLKHSHFKVRVACLGALEALVPCGGSGEVETLTTPMRTLVLDRNTSVRAAAVQTVKAWLSCRDREVYDALVLPIILQALTDPIPAVQEAASKAMDALGAQYEQDYADEIKQTAQYADSSADEHKGQQQQQQQQQQPLPRLGARLLVRKRLHRIIPDVLREMTQWTPEVRVATARLLRTVVLHGGEHVTSNLEGILSSLYKGAADDDADVRAAVLAAAKNVGAAVDPAAFVHLILPHTRGGSELGPISSQQRTAALRVLGALASGAGQARFAPFVETVVATMLKEAYAQSEDLAYLKALVESVGAMVEVARGSRDLDGLVPSLLLLLLQLQTARIPAEVSRSAAAIASALPANEAHLPYLLTTVLAGHASWTSLSPSRHTFEALLLKTKLHLAPHKAELSQAFTTLLDPKADHEVAKQMAALLRVLLARDGGAPGLEGIFVDIVQSVIVPNLVWRVGKTASQVRREVLQCLVSILSANSSATAADSPFPFKALFPVLLSALEDDAAETRSLAYEAFGLLLSLRPGDWDDEAIWKAQNPILKGLDDSNDDNRVVLCRTIARYFGVLQDTVSEDTLNRFASDLVLHLDDPNKKVQAAVRATLTELGARTYRGGSLSAKSVAHAVLQTAAPKMRNFVDSASLLKELQ